MNRTSIRALSLILLLPLSGWLVASTMAPASAQDPKPAPQAKPEGQKPDGQGPEGQRPEGGPRPRGDRRGPGQGPNLHGAMEQMGREMKAVSQTIADPTKNDATLQGLGRMLAGAGASQNGEPKNMAEIPAEGQAAHKLAFRRALVLLAKDIVEVELLVLDGKNAEAAAMFEKKIAAQRDAGHEKFGGDEDDEGPRPPAPGGAPK